MSSVGMDYHILPLPITYDELLYIGGKDCFSYEDNLVTQDVLLLEGIRQSEWKKLKKVSLSLLIKEIRKFWKLLVSTLINRSLEYNPINIINVYIHPLWKSNRNLFSTQIFNNLFFVVCSNFHT